MPIEWSIIFLGTIASCVYFSYQQGLKEGVIVATELTLTQLEAQGLIHITEDGTIKSGKRNKMNGNLIDDNEE